MPEAKVIEVIRVDVTEGKGVDDTDPVRRVVYYFDLRGCLLARRDEWEEKRKRAAD